MTREWFSVAQVGAARVGSLSPEYLAFLVADFRALSVAGKARLRRTPYNKKASRVEMEFHLSLFLAGEQAAIRRALGTGIFGRILKLGIHREVFDPRASYAPKARRRAA